MATGPGRIQCGDGTALVRVPRGCVRPGPATGRGSARRLPVRAPYQFADCGWVANRWCELLPLPPHLKQRLMELDSPLMRLELVSDLLARTGIAE